MTIITEFFTKLPDGTPDKTKAHKLEFVGETAADCMEEIGRFREYYDAGKYTYPTIVNVRD